jgi:hypothetical protein
VKTAVYVMGLSQTPTDSYASRMRAPGHWTS